MEPIVSKAPVNLPGSEVFSALSKGVIEAADYNVFCTKQEAGMSDSGAHPVQPGFHSLPLIDISVTQKCDKLPADLQEILTVPVRDFARDITTQRRIADQQAVKAARSNPEITIHDWSAGVPVIEVMDSVSPAIEQAICFDLFRPVSTTRLPPWR